jgi:hypothetical protein
MKILNLAAKASAFLLVFSLLILFSHFSMATTSRCLLEPMDGRTLVFFDGRSILSDILEITTLGPAPLFLSAGTYKVTLQSYDDHARKPQPQPQESWFVQLLDETGIMVASNAISDLPSDADTLVEIVNDRLTLSRDSFFIKAVHAAYPSSNPNSIVPVCAAFDLLERGNDEDGDKGVDKTEGPSSLSEDLHINFIIFDEEYVKAGDELIAYVNFENHGEKVDMKDVRVTAIIQELGVRSRTISADVDEDEQASKILTIAIPEDAEPGRYYVEIVVDVDGDRRIKYRSIDVV